MSRLHHIQPEVSIFAVSPNPPPKPRKIKSEPPPLKPAIWPTKQPVASMQLQQFLKAQRLNQKLPVQRGPPPLNKMQYFANDSRTEYQKQQQQMHQKLMQQRMANNNCIREDSPNPMDFLEIGVHLGVHSSNSIINNIPKDTKPKSIVKTGGSILPSDSSSRRKNANPRKVARENEIEPPRPNDHFLLSQIKLENLRQSCLLCERNFSNKFDLSQHISEVHGIEPSDLHQLNGNLGEDEELAESMMEAETVFFCEVCTREFQDKASLWLHMVRGHKQEAAVTCGVCMKICSDSKSLMEHVNTQHPKSSDTADSIQRRYRCQVCARQHDTKKKMMRHVVIHTVYDNDGQIIDPDKLIIINNNFHPTKASNNEHYTISCQVCHKVFPSEEKLLRHMSSIHLMTGCDDMITTAVVTTGNSSQSSFVNRCELCGESCSSRTEKWWHVLKVHGTDETLICPKPDCRKLFVSQSLQIEHQSHHETQGDIPNTCEVCGRLWPNRNDFYKHIMAVHAECMPLLCGICLKVHLDVPKLREHIKEKHEPLVSKENAIYCDICGRTYTKWSKMMRHRSIHNIEDQVSHFVTDQLTEVNLKCTLCPDTEFKTVEEISEHRKNDHQLHVCDLCSKYYSGNNHLWKHVSRQHKGHPDVTCSLCARTSASKVHLKRHMIKYHSDPVGQLIDKSNNDSFVELNTIHQCHRCEKVFRIRSLLKKHLKYCKGKKADVIPVSKEKGHYPCLKCGKTFEYHNYLNRHLRHSHQIQHCEICSEDSGEHFDSKMLLLDHIKEKHRNDPELCCDVEGCNKVLRTKADCQKHKREHARNKVFSYICEFCGDMHSNKKNFRKHLRQRHKGNTQYLCGVCMEVCVDNDGLSKHLHEVHPQTFTKSNICQLCGKMFTVGNKVGEHIDKTHGKNLKPCKICWKVFSDMDKLKEHIENHPAKEDSPKIPVKKPMEPKPKAPKLYGLPKELAELGFNEEQQENLKRDIDDVTSDINTKRLRKLHSCTVCYKSFRFETDLFDHKREEHSIIEDSYVEEETQRKEQQTPVPKSGKKTICGICRKEWISLKHFWQHLIRAHRAEAAFVCGVCCQITSSYDDLSLHLDNQHPNATVLSLFSCDICGRNHNAFSKLQKHRIIHSNAPPSVPKYHCDECELVFNTKSFGEKHILSHGPGSKLCKGKELCQEMDDDMLEDQMEEEEEEEEEEVEDSGDAETENKDDDDDDDEEEETEQNDGDEDDDNEQNDDVDEEETEENVEDDNEDQNEDVDAEEDKEQVEADDDDDLEENSVDDPDDVEENGIDDQDDIEENGIDDQDDNDQENKEPDDDDDEDDDDEV